jgi:DNA modification methylase
MEFNGTIGEPCELVNPGRQVFLDEMPGGAGNGDCIQGPLIPDFGSRPYQIYCGDALETIRRIKAGGTQFDCVISSPPYYRQRVNGGDTKELGQETSVDSFVSALVNIFKEVPLRPWASVWVNIGDKRGAKKELLEVPECFAIAMRRAGFFLIDKVVWAKEVALVDGKAIGHCMIEPAKDRLNGNGWEALYRFVVNPEKAWSDVSAVRIPRDPEQFFHVGTMTPIEQHPYSPRMKCATSLEGRNLSNVWYMNNPRKGENHHAAFPQELIERPVAMTCPEWLVDDGGEIRPRERTIEPTVYSEGPAKFITVFGQFSRWQEPHMHEITAADEESGRLEALREKSGRNDSARQYVPRYPKTVGWTHMDKPLVGAGIVFDPFGGTGTVGEIAVLLGRRFVGIDLYQEYADRMAERCEEAHRRLSQAGEAAPVLV